MNDAEAIRAKLSELGFSKVHDPDSREEIYERQHDKSPTYLVRVYSSIPTQPKQAHSAWLAGLCIRVISLQRLPTGNWQKHRRFTTRGVSKTHSVCRVGGIESVIEKLRGAAREAYSAINQELKSR